MKVSACTGAAAFSLSSLGSFFLSSLFFLPRVAGSLRTTYFPASEPPSWDSTGNFMYTTSPGIFLVLDIPRGTPFLKFYGHKRAGASLYGLCLGCNGVPKPIDGHDPSLTTGHELAPSCLFSLSISGPDVPPLELHNLFDPRFDMFGEISFSHVEYGIEDQADTSASNDPLHPCLSHFDWTRPHPDQALLPRAPQAPAPAPASAPAPAPASTSAKPSSNDLSGKMDLLIGLIAALITIVVVIFIIGILYMLYLRRRKRIVLEQLNPGNKLGQNDAQAPANKSATLFSVSETIAPDPPPKDPESLRYKDRYLTSEQKVSVISNPSSSFSTGAFETKYIRDPGFTQLRSPQADTTTIVSSASRPKSRPVPPATAPPSSPLPLPEVSWALKPVRSPQDAQGGSSRAEATALSPLSGRSQIESKVQRPQPARTQSRDPRTGEGRGRKNDNTLESAIPFRMRNQGSDGSDSSSESHSKSKPGPSHFRPTEQLPEPSVLLKPASPSPRGQESTVDERRSQRTGTSHLRRQLDDQLAEMEAHMQLIRESSMKPQLNSIASLRTPGPLERARSSDDIRQRIETHVDIQARTLRESKSSPELETPEVKLGVPRLQVSTPQKQDGLAASLRREPRARVRESIQPPPSPFSNRRLTIKLPEDPPGWLSPIPHIVSLYQDRDVEAQRLPAVLPTSLVRTVYSQKETEPLAVAKPAVTAISVPRRMPQPPEPVLRGNTARPPLPQPPSYKRAVPSTQSLTIEKPTIAPLSPRKRALPTPPAQS